MQWNGLRREDRRPLIWLILMLAACAIPLVAATLFQNVLLIAVALWYVAFDLYWFYVRYYKKRKPRYPMVPPEGKADIYSRANIPRPIHEDFRRMREKKRRFAELDKLKRRRSKKKV